MSRTTMTRALPKYAGLKEPAEGGLRISQPSDLLELEADRVTDEVLRMPTPISLAETGSTTSAEWRDGTRHHRGTEPGESHPATWMTQSRDYFKPQFVPGHSSGRVGVTRKGLPVGLDGSLIMRTPAAGAQCPAYQGDEVATSQQPAGILPVDTRIGGNNDELIIQDFAISRHTPPPNVTQSEAWQRAMSYIIGDPHMLVAVEGYADCHGDAQANLNLRQNRADSVVAILPQAARDKVQFNFSIDPNNYLRSNTSREGRAGNRAVRLTFRSIGGRTGQDACDAVAPTTNMDEYLFMVRCMEDKLGLGTTAQARTVLSVLRQIYYGNAGWSQNQNPIWNSVIQNRRWQPGTDPRPLLGNTLFNALQNSQNNIEGTDMGHLMTGLDAMLNPQFVEIRMGRFGFETGIPNEEWATWAGDVGSAVGHFSLDTLYGTIAANATHSDYFQRFAGDDDLLGNMDAFALRAAANPGGTPSSELMQAWNPNGPLSEILLQYFRLTSSSLGQGRGQRVQQFVEAYGGQVTNAVITNRADLERRLRPSIEEFAGYFSTQRMLQRGDPPQGAPALEPIYQTALQTMTRLYVDWLEQHL
ncbi:MAG: hypothetical protein LC540_08885 [Candidatus Thiodiazotropha sp.]|nr:hypothetical protein [Candidatus Thiodiazotropha sp.]